MSALNWILVPLGNPGEQYAATRHNLGRLMVRRWMDRKGLNPVPAHAFGTGTLYSLSPDRAVGVAERRQAGGVERCGTGLGEAQTVQRRVSNCRNALPIGDESPESNAISGLKPPFLALVPGTYMNLSGQICAEAVRAGLDPSRMLLVHDDKDLPLGMGRFRLNGGDGGHNGLRSVMEHLGGIDLARLRLGIGPCERPLHEFVLGEWTEDEWDRIAALDAPFGRFMDALAECGDLGELPGLVNAESFWM